MRKMSMEKKSNGKGIALIAVGVLVEIGVSYLRYNQALQGIADEDLKYRLVYPLCPLIVLASVCIFAGFSYLNLKKDFSKLSALTFLVYLFHAGIWDLLVRVVYKMGYEWNNLIAIPVCIIVVFIISTILSKIYTEIWKWIENKWKVSEKLCVILHL